MNKSIDFITKTLALASKIAVLIGGACVFTYSLRINHFPQEMSAGDGLLFIFSAACFGIIYSIFIACLVSLGIFISPILRGAFNAILWAVNLRRKIKIEPTHKLAPFEWSAVLPAFFSMLLIVAFGQQDSSAYWSLPSLSILLYLFYSLYKSSEAKLKNITLAQRSVVVIQESVVCDTSRDQENIKKGQMFCIAFILIIPLLLGGVSGQLIEAAMRFAHVRVEKPTLYIKDPYASLLPKTLISINQNVPKDYMAFKGIKVLFKGFGKATVISFHDGSISRMLEIPNDLIIIEEN